MKKIILFIAILMISCATFAQKRYSIEGKTITTIDTITKQKQKKEDIATGFTYKYKGVEYPVFRSKKGSCYIYRTSSKTGEPYKQYLGKEISADICKQIGVEYKPKK